MELETSILPHFLTAVLKSVVPGYHIVGIIRELVRDANSWEIDLVNRHRPLPSKLQVFPLGGPLLQGAYRQRWLSIRKFRDATPTEVRSSELGRGSFPRPERPELRRLPPGGAHWDSPASAPPPARGPAPFRLT